MERAQRHGTVRLDDLVGTDFPFRTLTGVIALTILFPLSARAETYSVDLTSPALFDHAAPSAAGETGGIWNTVDGRIQAGLRAVGVTTPGDIEFGDGSDGAFSDGPEQTGITISGSTVTVNTDTKSIFNFSSFHLSSGMTLVVSGSSALVIRVLGSTTIAGTISADGATGSSNTTTGAAPGGASGPGGGSGGTSGNIDNTAGTSGSSSDGALVGGGSFGTNSTTLGRGGGGGGSSGPDGAYDATDGASSIGSKGTGQSRSTIGDGFESSFIGGAGGGGGGSYTGATGTKVSGGGGGGGGGAIRISSLGSITIDGAATVSGGAGGSHSTAGDTVNGYCGGGGGGGSGGAVWLQSASSIGGTGSVTVSGGQGGTASLPCIAKAGGNGSRGILRTDAVGSNSLTSVPATIAQTATLASPSGVTYTVYSKAIDFTSGYWDFTSASETVASSGSCGSTGSVTITYQGSNDGVSFGNAVSAAGIAQLSEYPYLRFKVEIATNGTTPPCLTGLTISYSPKELSNLTLEGGLFCTNLADQTSHPSRRSTNPLTALGDFLLLALALFGAKITARRPSESNS